jgi:6-pyruvoyl-tetrahydropterin synthase-like protein
MQETLETDQTVKVRQQSFLRNQNVRKAAILLAFLFVSAISIFPYFFSHYEDTGGGRKYKFIKSHDIANHYFAMEQFEKTFRAGALYPRWYGDANRGYGIATPNFYPPGFYYCSTLANAVFRNWHTTLLILMTLAFAGSGAALYFLARDFFGRAPSAMAALFYMLLPYHQLELYWRGAFPEIIGFILIPLTLHFAYKSSVEGRWRNTAGLGLFYGLHLLTHFPVGLMFTYALAFYALVWAWKERDLKIAVRIGAGMLLGLAVSAVYWLPAALESKYAFENQTQIYPYHTAYISPLPTADPFFSIIEKTLKLNALLLIAAIIVLRASIQKKNETRGPLDRAKRQQSLWIIMCGVALFMTTAFSYDISILLPKIEIAVPPFRWLAISSVFTALLIAASVDRLMKGEGLERWRLWAYRGMTGTIVALNLFYCVEVVISDALANPAFEPVQDYIEQGLTPRGTTAPDKLPDTPLIAIEPAGGASEIVRWEPQSREARIQADQPSKVRFKTYNFPGWTARVNGQKTNISSDEDGAQLIDVPAGLSSIEVSLENTPPRTLGGALTIIGFLATLGLWIGGKLKNR